MVLRVTSVLVCLTIFAFTSAASFATAGGPPCYPEPSCAPPPYQCAPPSCGPRPCGPVPPFALCAGILNSCRNVCGTIIGIPAAVMGGLLAPGPGPAPWCRPACPPPACGPVRWTPPVCGPSTCAPPMCGPAPCPPPGRITKCRPAAYVPRRPARLRGAAELPIPEGAYVPASMHVPSPGQPGSRAAIEGLADMPAKLISGVFRVANPYGR